MAAGPSREATVLLAVLGGTRPLTDLVGSGHPRTVLPDRLTRAVEQSRRHVGVPQSVADAGRGWLRVDGTEGSLYAQVQLDASGRADSLLLRPAAAPARPSRLRRLPLPLAVTVTTLVIPLLFAATAATASTRLVAVAWLVAGVAVTLRGRRTDPWWWFGYRARTALGGLAGALWLVAAARLPFQPVGHLPGWLACLTGVVLLGSVLGLAPARLGGHRPVELASPVPSLRLAVAQGGGRATNHHAGVPAQRHALDLVAVEDGPRASRRTWAGRHVPALLPAELSAYRIYGAPVVAPVAGRVVQALDGLPDQPVLLAPASTAPPVPSLPEGNHVVIESGSCRVVLAHLQPGSLTVSAGDAVHVGQLLGRVGNSGNTSEPHLHLHAEQAGTDGPDGLPLMVAGRPTPRRNDTIGPVPGQPEPRVRATRARSGHHNQTGTGWA